MTTQQVADLFGVHRNTIDNERNAGRLRFFRVGTCVRFTSEQIEDYVRLQEHTQTTQRERARKPC